jgi:hypothetical protein
VKPGTTSFFVLQVIPLAIAALLCLPVRPFRSSKSASRDLQAFNQQPALQPQSQPGKPKAIRRLLASFTTAFSFAVALSYSNLTVPSKVISFLVLPLHPAFDPSLVYLAIGALPLSALLYRYGRGTCKPRLGGTWDVPNSGTIDAQLLLGAGVFGVGWGMSGICRMCFFFHPSDANLYNNIHIYLATAGPGLVNLGRALATGGELLQVGSWLGSVVLGGLLV